VLAFVTVSDVSSPDCAGDDYQARVVLDVVGRERWVVTGSNQAPPDGSFPQPCPPE
jgi:hypothetical protein